MSEAIHLEVSEGVATITLNRPQRLNAFNAELAQAWAETAQAVASDEGVQAIVAAGAGRAFCAGGDVRAMAEFSDAEADITALAHLINKGQLALLESAKPVVVAAHGTTAGGGLGILLCSDYAVVGESSKIGSLYANIGLSPDLSVSALLGRAIGERRALSLVLRDTLLSAREALDWGLVAEVVADDQVQLRAEEIARHWVKNSAAAYGEAKRLLRMASEQSLRVQLAEEARTIGARLATEDAKERIRKFAGA